MQNFRAQRSPPPNLQNNPSPLLISGYASVFTHVFALVISMPPVLKALIFIKLSPKLSYFCKKNFFSHADPQSPSGFRRMEEELQDPPKQPRPHWRFLVMRLTLNMYCSYIQV